MTEAPVRPDPVDVCIVGSGPAGAMLGAALVRSGISVAVLESGPRYPFALRPQAQRDYLRGIDPWVRKPEGLDVYSSEGALDYQLNAMRVRGVGGTSLHWQAETPRLHANDFRMRSTYGLAEDWPIDYPELEPYYVRAEHELGVAGGADPFASPRSAAYPLPPLPYNYMDQLLMKAAQPLGLRFSPIPQARNSKPYGGRSQCLGCATCTICPTGAKASVDLTHVPEIDQSTHGRVIEQATVLRLEPDARGRVRRAVYAGLDRVERAIEATVFVVAGGGIETPRLLLLSSGRQWREGLANRSGLVGKGFREHPICYSSGNVTGPSYAHRISFWTATSNQFWNSPDRVHRSAFSVIFRPMCGPSPSEIARTSTLWGDRLDRLVKAEFGHTVTVESPIEMLSYARNSVDLDPELRDYHGSPAPRIRLSLGEYEAAGVRAAQQVHSQILQAFGATGISADPNVGVQAHPSGTCRMGSDPSLSVVDRDLRCHDVPNLYLVGSGAFTTSGLANPTLTIGALALRLGDHLVGASRAGALQ
jgi:choline dehydrogenase-like flavoprotein